ncbi:hypothetical protein QCA50_016346 [Cerrena zonata]|uniref:Cytochrome P450 monooxygenase n=1 Tax=Cerrena zonata TaxID=2478898 RepID=A0AAW0FM09_9APHY
MLIDTVLAVLFTHGWLHFMFKEPRNITGPLKVILSALLVVMILSDLSIKFCLIHAGTYLLLLVTSVAIYRVSPFHPLAKFPGPVLNKITKLAGMQNSWGGHGHRNNHELHKKYGPIVRVGPNDLSIVDVDAVTSVLGANGLPKGRYYDARQDPNAPSNLIILREEPHAHRRRLWNRGLTPEALREYEAIIAKRASQVISQIQESKGDIDFASYVNYFTFDVMGDMAFGRGFNMITEGDKDGLWDTLERWAFSAAVISHMPWAVRLWEKLPAVSHELLKLRKFGFDCAMQRAKGGATSKDLWYHLSDEAGLEKEKPTLREVASDGALAVIAGADTTASALASLFWSLIRNPEVYKRLQNEIDTVYADHANPLSTEKHSKLVYLNACINETLRLYPPVPTNGPRQVWYGAGPHVVAGSAIPEGTQIYVPPYSLHRDPRYFSPNPETFIPERWLESDKTMNTLAFIPFSYGPANCVGRQMAKQEMLMFASVLLQNFTFSFAKGFDSDDWPNQMHDYFVTTRGPLLLHAEPRTI